MCTVHYVAEDEPPRCKGHLLWMLFGSSCLCVLHLDSSEVAAQDTGQGTPPFPVVCCPEQPVGVSDCSTGLQTFPQQNNPVISLRPQAWSFSSRRAPPTLADPHQSPPQASLLPAETQTATRTGQTPLCPRTVPTGPSPSPTRDLPPKRRTLQW